MPSRPLIRKKLFHVVSGAIGAGALDIQIGQNEINNQTGEDVEIFFIMPDGRDAATSGARANDWGWRIRMANEADVEICPRTPVGQIVDPQTRAWDWSKELPERRTGYVWKHGTSLKVYIDNLTGGNIWVYFTIHCWTLGE